MKKLNCEKTLGSYLSGLWEGDGYIGLADDARKIRPYFALTFHKREEEACKKLQSIIGGRVRYKTKENALVLTLRSIANLCYVVKIMNGFLRTPKIYQFNSLITWLNTRYSTEFPLYTVDKSLLNLNAWLSGFIDAYGCFKVRYQEKKYDKLTNKIIRKSRVAISFVIEQRQVHNKTGEPYKNIMLEILSFFDLPEAPAKLRISKHNNKEYWLVEISSISRLKLLIEYLNIYNLQTTKYLNFKDWCLVYQLILEKNHLTEEGKKKIKEIKQGMNRNRK